MRHPLQTRHGCILIFVSCDCDVDDEDVYNEYSKGENRWMVPDMCYDLVEKLRPMEHFTMVGHPMER